MCHNVEIVSGRTPFTQWNANLCRPKVDDVEAIRTHNLLLFYCLKTHTDKTSHVKECVLLLFVSVFFTLWLFRLCFMSETHAAKPKTWCWKCQTCYFMQLSAPICVSSERPMPGQSLKLQTRHASQQCMTLKLQERLPESSPQTSINQVIQNHIIYCKYLWLSLCCYITHYVPVLPMCLVKSEEAGTVLSNDVCTVLELFTLAMQLELRLCGRDKSS